MKKRGRPAREKPRNKAYERMAAALAKYQREIEAGLKVYRFHTGKGGST